MVIYGMYAYRTLIIGQLKLLPWQWLYKYQPSNLSSTYLVSWDIRTTIFTLKGQCLPKHQLMKHNTEFDLYHLKWSFLSWKKRFIWWYKTNIEKSVESLVTCLSRWSVTHDNQVTTSPRNLLCRSYLDFGLHQLKISSMMRVREIKTPQKWSSRLVKVCCTVEVFLNYRRAITVKDLSI